MIRDCLGNLGFFSPIGSFGSKILSIPSRVDITVAAAKGTGASIKTRTACSIGILQPRLKHLLNRQIQFGENEGFNAIALPK